MNPLYRRLARILKYLLVGAAVAILPLILAAFLTTWLTSPEERIASWRYGRFLDALENQTVEQVTLDQTLSVALIQTADGQMARVNLPDDPNLEDLLIESSAEVLISETPVARGSVIYPTTIVTIGAYLLVGSILWLWILIDCALQEADQGNTKIAWILIIIFTAWMGAFAYFLFRRPQRKRELGR
ncbi:MAG: PLD nuclease N-terminal domain-containing protein [Cyanobacteria bacterium P01_C01_bin.120]